MFQWCDVAEKLLSGVVALIVLAVKKVFRFASYTAQLL